MITYDLQREEMLRAATADARTEILLDDFVDVYQDEALRFAFFPKVWSGSAGVRYELAVYPGMAMLGEIGELAEKLTQLDDVGPTAVIRELGDVLWYAAATARVFGFRLSEVAGGLTWSDANGAAPDWLADEPEGFVFELMVHAGKFVESHVKKPWRDGTRPDAARALDGLRLIIRDIEHVADCFGQTMDGVAQANIDKLVARRQRGTLTGSGDNR